MVKDTLTQIGITSTPLAHIEWSQTQHITAWNKKAELLFGYKKAQVLNQPLSVLFPRGKKETLKQLTSLTTPTEVLLENITASGTSLICEWHTLPRRDNSDGNTGLALVRDVTTLQKLDDELASLRHRHDLILENAGEGIFGLDTLGKLTFINKAAEKMFGWKRNEMIGRRMHDLTHYKKPDGKKLTYNKCPIYLSYAGGKIQQGTDEYFIRKNGELFPIEYTSIPIRENGELQGVVVTFKDITRRKENEKALQVSEEKYRSVVLALNEGVILQGADGKVQAYNTRAEEILGISSDVMSGKKTS